MRTQREIFEEIAISLLKIIPKEESFHEIVLEIKRLKANIGFSGYYYSNDDRKKWLNIFDFDLEINCIEELYMITQTQFPIHKNWNRAIYKLFPDGKMNIEYIWDHELQEQVDSINED